VSVPAAYVVIVGCGRLGSTLANTLSELGDSVVIIDHNESSFARLSGEFSGFRLTGDAADLAVLREARMDRADVVLAATDRDNLNLFIAQAAKVLFGVDEVAARLWDPTREAVFDEFDITMISPTMLGAEAFLAFVQEVCR
jgi:trk system potassium uptake protein TrkA